MPDQDMKLWVETYRPHSVSECILPKRLKDHFQALVDKKTLENMTLVGSAGVGKTSVARAMCEEMGIDYLVINASSEGIDMVRTKLVQFASTVSFSGGIKCVILDEGDGLGKAAQQALRNAIEEFQGNCRFIITANFGNQIIEALTSRCPVVDMNVLKEERKDLILQVLRRIAGVLKEKGIVFTPEELSSVVLKNYPDLRKTWNLIQRYSSSGVLEITNQTGLTEESLKELTSFLKAKKFTDMRKWVVENLDNDGASLRRSLYNHCALILNPSSIPQLVLYLAEYDYKESFVADKEINTVAMLTMIMSDCQFL
jgi:replication factor C small subunit